MKLKENLRFLRKKNNMTQGQLAKRLHVRQYNISDYEIGRIEPSIDILIKFADAFHVSVDYLIGHKVKEDKAGENEQNVDNYIGDMSIDKYLLRIYEDIRDLGPNEKRIIANTVHFTADNIKDLLKKDAGDAQDDPKDSQD